MCLPLILLAQAPDTLWTRTYGGSNSDAGHSVIQTTDGGYIIAGETGSFGNGGYDAYIVKVDANGDTMWTKVYGGINNDQLYSILQTNDGGYIAVGYTGSFGSGGTDVYIIRIDSLGDTLWTRTYGGAWHDEAYAIQPCIDNSFYVAGHKGSSADDYNVLLFKLLPNGAIPWVKTYGDAIVQFGYSAYSTSDSGLIIAGSQWQTNGYYDFYVIKTDFNGDTLWTRTYGGVNQDIAQTVQQTNDGGFIVAGWTESYGAGLHDFYLVKLNNVGDTLWTRTYGYINQDMCFSIQQTNDNGYIAVGSIDPLGNNTEDLWLLKTDEWGDTLWTRTYGEPGGDETGFCVAQTIDEGFIIVGGINSHGAGSNDVYLLRLDSELKTEEKKSANIKNPFNITTILNGSIILPANIPFRVFDITGRIVTPDPLKPGVYFIEIDGRVTQKVVKVR